jgi:hypothetical protein
MKNETKNAEKTSVGEANPKFQQAEPAELDEAALLNVAGGVLAISYHCPEPTDNC